MSTTIAVSVDDKTLKRLVIDHLNGLMQENVFKPADLQFMVKTSQNYKAEWEQGEFKVEGRRFDVE